MSTITAIQKQSQAPETNSRKSLHLHWNCLSAHWLALWNPQLLLRRFCSGHLHSWRWKSWRCGRNRAWKFGTAFPGPVWPHRRPQDAKAPLSIYQYRVHDIWL